MEAIREASNAHDIVDAIIGKVRARLLPVDHGDNFLRSTALDSWVKGGGQCGDAARVIVLMLRSVGIDAGRVYLRAEPGNYFHVAVAYHVGERSYLVDTVNSTSEFRRFVETHRRHALGEIEMPNSQFSSYSYVNWGRLGPFMQVDRQSRLPSMAVLFMESPLLVLALLKAGVAVSLAFAGYHCRLLRRTSATSVLSI